MQPEDTESDRRISRRQLSTKLQTLDVRALFPDPTGSRVQNVDEEERAAGSSDYATPIDELYSETEQALNTGQDKEPSAFTPAPQQSREPRAVDVVQDDEAGPSAPPRSAHTKTQRQSPSTSTLRYNTLTYEWFQNLSQSESGRWLLSETSLVCLLASDATWIVLQLLEELSSASGSQPVQWLGTALCLYLLLVCVPVWCVAAVAVYAQCPLPRLYTAKHVLTGLVAFAGMAVTLVNNAPYWKLLTWLTSIPYFAAAAFLCYNYSPN